jgi:tRNA-Thr(GGU) m(6)t(6)A37 methyltransferase TsaA
MKNRFYIYPVGEIRKQGDTAWIEIKAKYSNALLGLNEFSHITVCYWFHKNDTPENRNIMQVHPRRNKNNPLTGVFATHSPVRPNLIAISICKILSIENNTIYLDKIDAIDQTPVIDIKSFIPSSVSPSDLRMPNWV